MLKKKIKQPTRFHLRCMAANCHEDNIHIGNT